MVFRPVVPVGIPVTDAPPGTSAPMSSPLGPEPSAGEPGRSVTSPAAGFVSRGSSDVLPVPRDTSAAGTTELFSVTLVPAGMLPNSRATSLKMLQSTLAPRPGVIVSLISSK